MYKLPPITLSVLIGNIVEHFDSAIYALLVPILAPLFFPHHDPVVQLILGYSVLGTSILTRPLGVMLFGIMAHRKGPRYALSWTIVGITILTILIGFLPTYQAVGWMAPCGLILLRMFKGIFTAGEHTIAKLYILEEEHMEKARVTSYVYQTTSVVGIILASLSVMILTNLEDPSQHWRMPFFIGGITALVGLHLRRSLKDSQHHKKAFEDYELRYWKIIWTEKKAVLRVALANSVSHVTYAFPFVFLNAFVPLITSVTLSEMMAMNTGLLVLDMILIPVLGMAFKRFSSRAIMLYSSVLLGLTIIPCFIFLKGATFWYITTVRCWIVLLGVIYLLPLNIWCLNQFKGHSKYLLVGIGSSLGASTIGKLTPAICLYLWHATGLVFAPAIFAAVVWLLAGWAIKSSK